MSRQPLKIPGYLYTALILLLCIALVVASLIVHQFQHLAVAAMILVDLVLLQIWIIPHLYVGIKKVLADRQNGKNVSWLQEINPKGENVHISLGLFLLILVSFFSIQFIVRLLNATWHPDLNWTLPDVLLTLFLSPMLIIFIFLGMIMTIGTISYFLNSDRTYAQLLQELATIKKEERQLPSSQE